MKKIYYLIAMAFMALTFTSCEDVPAPYGQPTNPNANVTVDPAGSGTVDDPFNVAAAIAKCKEIGSTVSSEKYYVKGYAATATTADAQYGNVTFEMCDSKDGKGKKFTAYQVAGTDGQKLAEGFPINVGDEIVVYGAMYYYNNSKAETTGQGKAWIVTVNGEKTCGGSGTTPSGEAKGSGTEADAYNATAANAYISTLAADTESDKDIYVKGKVVKYANNGEFSTQYGNASFYISDDGTEDSEQFYVFRTLYLGNAKYTGGDTPKVGDEVVICGRVVNYRGNTPETAANKSYIFSLNGTTGGGGSSTPTPSGEAKGTGTQADPFNVQAIINFVSALEQNVDTDAEYYVKGIVTQIPNNGISTQYNNVSFYISDDTSASNKFYVFRAKGLNGGDVTENMIKVGDEVVIFGSKWVNYQGNTPETKQGEAYIVSITPGEGGGGSGSGDSGSGATATSLTNGDFETWANGLPTGWKSASTASSATLEQSTDAHGGSYSVIVKGDEGSNKRLASQEITLEAGNYTFSFWVKPTTSDAAQVRPGYVPVTNGSVGSYAYGDYTTLSAGWQQVTYNFTLATESTVCLVVMNPKKSNYSSGKDVLIDDATLTKQ